jgi:hypothetical protein
VDCRLSRQGVLYKLASWLTDSWRAGAALPPSAAVGIQRLDGQALPLMTIGRVSRTGRQGCIWYVAFPVTAWYVCIHPSHTDGTGALGRLYRRRPRLVSSGWMDRC